MYGLDKRDSRSHERSTAGFSSERYSPISRWWSLLCDRLETGRCRFAAAQIRLLAIQSRQSPGTAVDRSCRLEMIEVIGG